jgi:DNA repair exonuclease SbcCD nuclease subunit
MTAHFRFVHCSDVHFDAPFRCTRDDVRARLADARRVAFRRLVSLCLNEKAHALLIAGDLYDEERLSFGSEDFLTEQIHRLTDTGIHVVIASGNNDPGSEDHRSARIVWPTERFHLLTEADPRTIEITDADDATVGIVVGAGHGGNGETTNLAASYPRVERNPPAVALLHASVLGAEDFERHPKIATCSPEDFGRLGYRYWALGHVHTRQQVCDKPVAWYPGSLIGRRAEETGAHGALLVSLPAVGATQVDFRPLSPVRWESIVLDGLSGVTDRSALMARAVEAGRAVTGSDDALPEQQWMLRFVLKGGCPAADVFLAEGAFDDGSAELAGRLGVLDAEIVVDDLTRPVEIDPHREQPHLLGLALELVEELDTDQKLLLELSPDELAGCVATDARGKRRYLRSLLDDIERVTADSLLKETRV